MLLTPTLSHIRGRIAEIGIRQADLAACIWASTKHLLNAIPARSPSHALRYGSPHPHDAGLICKRSSVWRQRRCRGYERSGRLRRLGVRRYRSRNRDGPSPQHRSKTQATPRRAIPQGRPGYQSQVRARAFRCSWQVRRASHLAGGVSQSQGPRGRAQIKESRPWQAAKFPPARVRGRS